MFGFGKKKEPPPRPERVKRNEESRERKSQNRAQLGFLAGVTDDGDIDNLMGNMDVGDDDLEEELAMLLEGNAPPPRPKTSPKKSAGGGGERRAAGPDFDDEGDDMDDADLDDPELEAELGDILGISSSRQPAANLGASDEDDSPPTSSTMSAGELLKLLQERLEMYEQAKCAAESVGDTAKSRRFDRGLKSLKGLLSKAKAGRVVDESEIPPAVAIGTIKKEREPRPQDVTSHQVPTPEDEMQIDNPPAPAHRSQFGDDSQDFTAKLPEPLSPSKAPPVPPRPSPRKIVEDPPPPPSAVIEPIQCEELTPVEIDPMVEARLKDYKLVAVTLKRRGEVQKALQYLKLSKQLETAAKSGESINLNEYPTTDEFTASSEVSQEALQSSSPVPDVPPLNQEVVTEQPQAASDDIFGAPPPPKTVMEALEQRLAKYKSEVEKATEASNSSKARRMGRIVKQYEEAIVAFKKGKPVPFDELPTPPGFAPIPVGPAPPPPAAVAPQPERHQLPQPGDSPQPGGSPKKPKEDSPSGAKFGSSPSSTTGSITRGGKPVTKLTLQEKQLQAITLRQHQFKEAALNAKKRGDIDQAREFLRTAKGFDKLIQYAQAGLPVDMATMPSPPEAVARLELEEEGNFEVVSASDCIMPSGSAGEIFAKLEEDLKKQLKMCMRTRDHFKSMGDVASANRFEGMALESKRDLDTVRLAMKQKGGVPKYHYENRIFSITECNTDVNENEIEVNIIQGFNYKVSNPSDVDTYVKIELPWPSAEEVQINKTQLVKDTNSPEYNATFKMSINRTARNFQRFVHRHGLKCEVWSKGGLCSGFFCKCNSGFLRSSSLIGTSTVKFLPLETKCTLHDAFDILDGRKPAGKLEVKVKIREPVLAKQITQKKEKWLSIDRA